VKAIDMLVDNVLPPDMRGVERDYGTESVQALVAQVAREHPDRYAQVSKDLADIGRNAAYTRGETLGWEDMRPTFDRTDMYRRLDLEVAALPPDLSPEERRSARARIFARYVSEMDDQVKATSGDTALGRIVRSGARGNMAQLRMLTAGSGMFMDYLDRPVDLFIRHSYGEGVRPAEYAASMFGTRKAVLSTKNATADAGDLGKQLARSAARLVITTDDCGTSNGLSMPSDRARGRVLARDAGDLPSGSVLDRHSMAGLKGNVVARSPVTCQAREGLCARCVGVQGPRGFPRIGDTVGIDAASAVAEPIAQAGLNCLVEGTLVRMADYSVRQIQDIRIGDLVLGADILGRTFPTRVTGVWDQGMQPTRRHAFERSEDLIRRDVEATDKHEFLARVGRGLRKVPIGCALTAACALADGLGFRERASVSAGYEEKPCWDITVEHPDSLFVLANGLICSNTKHTGGVGGKAKRTYTGFQAINQLMQSPSNFPDRAAVSEVEGTVSKIEPAPQGGTWITVGDRRHYALPNMEPRVKVGDDVEAGDWLSDGLEDPEDVLRLRGLGEARKFWIERVGRAFEESGLPVEPRNMEILARAAMDHVRITGNREVGEYLPDDLASYSRLASNYAPPASSRPMDTQGARDKYLQQPVLHYTIGTRLSPRMLREIRDSGVAQIQVSDDPPEFEPAMVGMRRAPRSDPDWMVKQHGTYLEGTLLQDAHGGALAETRGSSHYAPSLAMARDFGKNVRRTGKF